uniref:Uncharacterized protein n=1 Tax=Oryza brachyantha TaxID=4533 RepID=J3MJM5_ORYBR
MAKARLKVSIAGLSSVSVVAALIVLSAVVQQDAAAVVAQVIKYPVMNRDHIPGTPQLNQPAASGNKWTRGCSPQQDCRDNKDT